MVEEYLDKMAPTILELMPSGWEKVIIFSEIDPLHYNMFFYVKLNGKYIQCYNLPEIFNVTETEIDNAFEKWYDDSVENKKDEKWTNYTVTIDKTGKFKVDYSYDEAFDLFEWKKKYLGQ